MRWGCGYTLVEPSGYRLCMVGSRLAWVASLGVWPSFSLVGFALWALFPACVLRRMEYILCVCAFSLFFHVFLICPAVNEQSPKLLEFVSYKS